MYRDTRRAVCCIYWVPRPADTDWRLQSDGTPDSRLQDESSGSVVATLGSGRYSFEATFA